MDSLDRLERLFKAARMHPPGERAAFLDAACAGDRALREELESLLAADAEADADAFLDTPVVGEEAPEPESAAFERGRRIGAYTLLRRIGQGGMGDVYLALREEPFRQYVALKVMRGGMNTRDVLQRFAMERQILASLSHPNIARLLDGGSTPEGLAYFVMEYVDGRPLTRYCDEKQLSITERLRLFQVVCRAVHAAHQNLVIHRDLKPSNILVTESGVVKLLDFGVAKLLNPALSNVEMPVTQTAYRLLTPSYASPEQLRGESVTTASDVYSLGVILYELLTGHRPYRFERTPVHEMARVLTERDPARPSTCIRRNVPVTSGEEPTTQTAAAVSAARATSADRLERRLRGDLDTIVLMALRKEAVRRYPSAEQFAADLDRHLAGLPVEARPATLRYRLRSFARRHRVSVAAACLVTLSLVGGLSAALWQAAQARRDRDRVAQELAKNEEVTTFLMGLFEASDPADARGADVTAHDLLRRGRARAEHLSDQPAVQAQLLRVIGQAHASLGQYDQARPLLEEALAKRRSLPGDHRVDVAQSLTDLALLRHRRGEYPAAESLYRDALALHRALPASVPAERSRTLHHLGVLLRDEGDFEASEAALREALAIRQDHRGPRHPDVIASLDALGVLLHERGAYDDADSLLRRALALRTETLGADHPDVAQSMIHLGALLADKKDFDAVEVLYREALALQRKVLGPEHPDVARTLNHVAFLRRSLHDLSAADSLHREALALQRKVLGPEHPDVARTLHDLGWVHYERGDTDTAERLIRDALAMRRRLLDSRHPDIADNLRTLAFFYRRRRQYREAEGVILEALDIYRALVGEDHLRIALLYEDIGLGRYLVGEYDTAAAYVRQALGVYENVLGADSPDAGSALANLGMIFSAQGDYDAAEDVSRRALAVAQLHHAADDPVVATRAYALGGVLHRKGAYEAAEALYLEALRIRRGFYGEDTPSVQAVQNSLDTLYTDWRPGN